MNAILQAKRLYAEQGRNFEERLGWYLMHGLVVSREDRFLMAKPINSKVGEADWCPETPDTWYVEMAVGKGALEWFLLQAPYRLPKLAFRRIKKPNAPLKFYSTDQFERLS